MSVDKKSNLNCVILGVLCILVVIGIYVLYSGDDENSNSTHNSDQEGSNKRELNNKYKFNQKKENKCENNNSPSHEKKINTEQKFNNLDDKKFDSSSKNRTLDKNIEIEENNIDDKNYSDNKKQSLSSNFNASKDQKYKESNTSLVDDIQGEEISTESNTSLVDDIKGEEINKELINLDISDESSENCYAKNFDSSSFERKIRILRSFFPIERCSPENHYSIEIDRNLVLEDSLSKIMPVSCYSIKQKKFFIKFKDELGADYGGITKEWLELITKEFFNIDLGLFTYSTDDKTTLRPLKQSDINNSEDLQYFKLMGRILGIAIINEFNINAHFDKPVLKYITNRKCDLKDLKKMEPLIYKSMIWIRDFSTESDLRKMNLDFTYENNIFGHNEIVELIHDGKNIPVTHNNKHKYIDLLVEYILTKSIKEQLDEIKKGLFELIDENLITQFDEYELELLICGSPEIDVDDWKKNTEYVRCTSNHYIVLWFWKAVSEFNFDERANLLKFCTGSSRVPYGGFKNLQSNIPNEKFKISFIPGNSENYPTSHTCSNTLELYEYSSFEKFKDKLLYAITYQNEKFGFE